MCFASRGGSRLYRILNLIAVLVLATILIAHDSDAFYFYKKDVSFFFPLTSNSPSSLVILFDCKPQFTAKIPENTVTGLALTQLVDNLVLSNREKEMAKASRYNEKQLRGMTAIAKCKKQWKAIGNNILYVFSWLFIYSSTFFSYLFLCICTLFFFYRCICLCLTPLVHNQAYQVKQHEWNQKLNYLNILHHCHNCHLLFLCLDK